MSNAIPASWLHRLDEDCPYFNAIRACPACFNRATIARKLGTDCTRCPEHALPRPVAADPQLAWVMPTPARPSRDQEHANLAEVEDAAA